MRAGRAGGPAPRILVTGATGFIGRHALAPLRARGFEVHSLGRSAPEGVRHHAADLMDRAAMRSALLACRPSHLLHLAWSVPPGRFWQAPENLDWVASSLDLVRVFAAQGGRRVVVAGSCAECFWRPPPLYALAKDALRRLLAAADVPGLAWGRVFQPYGPGEPPGRLIRDAIDTLRGGGRFVLATSGEQRRDLIHVHDVGAAFAALAAGEAVGCFDIGTGAAPPLREAVLAVARALGAEDRVGWGEGLAPGEPAAVEADPSRLREELGFVPVFDLGRGIAQTLAAALASGGPLP